MAGWNKPNAANQPEVKKGGAKSPSLMKGVIVGAVAVVVGVVCIFAFSGKSEKPARDTGTKPAKIKDVKPAVTPKPVVVTNATPVVTNTPRKRVSMKDTNPRYKLPPGARVMTMMDGTVVTNVPPQPIFKRPFENVILAALRPTGTGKAMLESIRRFYTEEQLMQMLKEKIPAEAGDSEMVKESKRAVQQTKDDILAEVASGKTLTQIFDSIAHENALDQMTRIETMKMQVEAIRSGNAEAVRDAVDVGNKLREKRGLKKLEVPERFKDHQSDAAQRADEAPAGDDAISE